MRWRLCPNFPPPLHFYSHVRSWFGVWNSIHWIIKTIKLSPARAQNRQSSPSKSRKTLSFFPCWVREGEENKCVCLCLQEGEKSWATENWPKSSRDIRQMKMGPGMPWIWIGYQNDTSCFAAAARLLCVCRSLLDVFWKMCGMGLKGWRRKFLSCEISSKIRFSIILKI